MYSYLCPYSHAPTLTVKQFTDIDYPSLVFCNCTANYDAKKLCMWYYQYGKVQWLLMQTPTCNTELLKQDNIWQEPKSPHTPVWFSPQTFSGPSSYHPGGEEWFRLALFLYQFPLVVLTSVIVCFQCHLEDYRLNQPATDSLGRARLQN